MPKSLLRIIGGLSGATFGFYLTFIFLGTKAGNDVLSIGCSSPCVLGGYFNAPLLFIIGVSIGVITGFLVVDKLILMVKR